MVGTFADITHNRVRTQRRQMARIITIITTLVRTGIGKETRQMAVATSASLSVVTHVNQKLAEA